MYSNVYEKIALMKFTLVFFSELVVSEMTNLMKYKQGGGLL